MLTGQQPKPENWVIILRSPVFRAGVRENYVEINDGGNWIALPACLPLPKAKALFWRNEFETLLSSWSMPIPRNLLRVKVGIMNILRLFIDSEKPLAEIHLPPAGKLKQLKLPKKQVSGTRVISARLSGRHLA